MKHILCPVDQTLKTCPECQKSCPRKTREKAEYQRAVKNLDEQYRIKEYHKTVRAMKSELQKEYRISEYRSRKRHLRRTILKEDCWEKRARLKRQSQKRLQKVGVKI